jgi:hypothetical protein
MVDTYSIVPSADHTPITRNCDARHANIILRDQLVTALVLTEIPDPHVSTAITTNQLPLVRMDHHIIDRYTVHIIALYIAAPCVPDLHRAVFR